MKLFKILSLIALGLILQAESCSESPENQANIQKAIAPPFEDEKMNIQSENWTITESGGTLSLPNGTQITVPAQCFVDASGNPIQGKVNLAYREFHSSADIIASGIKMSYDSANQTEYFESAGMFDIRGTTPEGKPIFMAKDKKIDIQMASFVAGNYNSYYLNEETRNWEFVTQTPTTVNPIKQAKLDKVAPLPIRPIEPKAVNPNDFVFELKTDLSKYPELREMEGVMFQFAGKNEAQNPENEEHQWVWERKWGDINLVCTDRQEGLFRLAVKTDDRIFETIVTPVLRGSKLEKARQLFAQKMEEYEAAKIQRQAEAKRLSNEASLLRSFEVRGLGTHNFDVIMPRQDRLIFAAEFDFGKEIDLTKSQVSVFMIPELEGSTAVRFMPDNWKNFWILPSTPTKLIAILPNQEVAVLSTEALEKWDKAKIQKEQKAKIQLKLIPQPLKNVGDLDKIIAQL